jgi:hypothetical protein
MEKFNYLQTAEDAQKALVELKKQYILELEFLIEEYKRLSPIQIGDKVKITYSNNNRVALGGCAGFDVTYFHSIELVINKLKKDGSIAGNGRLIIYHDTIVEKI